MGNTVDCNLSFVPEQTLILVLNQLVGLKINLFMYVPMTEFSLLQDRLYLITPPS